MRERDEGLQEADKTETAFYYLQPLPKTGKLTYARLSKKKSDTDAGGNSSVGVSVPRTAHLTNRHGAICKHGRMMD